MARARIAVVGLWHLGSVAAAALAELGHQVHATDWDSRAVEHLAQGIPPVDEPGLGALLARQIEQGRLAFSSSPRDAFAEAEFIFLTFDTPVDEADQSDLGPVFTAGDTIALHARDGVEVVGMSQVPVGTCQNLAERIRARAPKLDFRIVYHPENLRLGQAIETFLRPDFLLVGAENDADAERLLGLYNGVEAPRLKMSLRSAELSKHALNAFLATSVSFSNELAALAEACGADIRDTVRALRHDRRIGPHAFLSPGPGFSGGTLARDVQALRMLGERAGRAPPVLDAAWAVNRERLPTLLEKIRQACGALRGLRVGLLGLTYKPGTDTLRRSAALELAELLRGAGCAVQAFDPRIRQPRAETRDTPLCADAYEAARDADALVVMTPWPEFQQLDLTRLRAAMRQPVLLDAHNVLDDSAARRAGWRYFGTGVAQPAARAGAGASP